MFVINIFCCFYLIFLFVMNVIMYYCMYSYHGNSYLIFLEKILACDHIVIYIYTVNKNKIKLRYTSVQF